MGDDIYKGRGTEDESDACHDAGDGWLRDTYAGQEYSVVNEYAEYERTEVAFVGLLWLLLVFLLVLLVLEAMVVSARLTGFVLAQRGNLRRLYGLGASAGTLIRAYSGQAERAAAWGMILTRSATRTCAPAKSA